MRYLSQLAASLLIATLAHAQIHMPQLSHKTSKDDHEDVAWIAPFANPTPDGRGAELVHDPRFKSFLRDHLTAPQTFWNDNESLYETAYEFFGQPNQVLLDDNRYLAADGCVTAFCPARGLLFIDLGTAHPFVAFAAVDWVKDNKATDQSGAEYTLWIFANHTLRTDAETTGEAVNSADPNAPTHIPTALTAAIARWAALPIPGTDTYQNITHAILVDPNGTPHQVPPATAGVTGAHHPSSASESPNPKPASTTTTSTETNK